MPIEIKTHRSRPDYCPVRMTFCDDEETIAQSNRVSRRQPMMQRANQLMRALVSVLPWLIRRLATRVDARPNQPKPLL